MFGLLRGKQWSRFTGRRTKRVGRAKPKEIHDDAPRATGDLLALVERDLLAERGFRATARAVSAKVKLLGLLGALVVLFWFHVAVRPRANLGEYSALAFWGVVTLLFAAYVAGSRALASGLTAPLRARRVDVLVVITLLAAPFVASLLAPLGEPSLEARGAWGSPVKCFGYGLAFASPLLLLAWLFERREVIPPRVLVLAGALAGVAANLLLHAHCPSVNVGHLLLGHASIGVAFGALLLVAVRAASRLRAPRSASRRS